MTLVELQACIRSSPNYRDLYQRMKEAAISGKASIEWPSDKLNQTLIDDLKKGHYKVDLAAENSLYVISGW